MSKATACMILLLLGVVVSLSLFATAGATEATHTGETSSTGSCDAPAFRTYFEIMNRYGQYAQGVDGAYNYPNKTDGDPGYEAALKYYGDVYACGDIDIRLPDGTILANRTAVEQATRTASKTYLVRRHILAGQIMKQCSGNEVQVTLEGTIWNGLLNKTRAGILLIRYEQVWVREGPTWRIKSSIAKTETKTGSLQVLYCSKVDSTLPSLCADP